MYTRAFSGTGNVGQAAAEAVVSVGIVFLATLLVVPLVLRGESLVGESDFGVGRPHMLAGMFALVGIVALLLPLWWDALAAFTTGRSVALQPLAVALSHPTLSPFSAAWNSGIGIGMWESLVLALMVVVLALALGFPAAFGLALLDRHRSCPFRSPHHPGLHSAATRRYLHHSGVLSSCRSAPSGHGAGAGDR